MKFIVIEIKDKDLYTIYDVENKGVCCCSAYTLKQLISDKNEVIGCKIVNGKLNVFECDLEGNKRARKASNCCDDTTKRSAVTIEKGLDEKHYPRVKTERKGTNETSVKIKLMSGQLYELHINDIKKFVFDDTSKVIGQVVSYNVSTHYLKLVCDNGKMLTFIPEYRLADITTCRLTQQQKQFFSNLGKINEKYYNCEAELVKLKAQYKEEQQKLYEKYGTKISSLELKLKELLDTLVDKSEKNVLSNNAVLNEDLIKKLIKINLKDKLRYIYTGNIGYMNRENSNASGYLDVSIHRKGTTLNIIFYVDIECRETRDWIKDNIADQEYDGTLSIDSNVYTGAKADKYWQAMNTDLKKGEKQFYYGSCGEISKGYYTKGFALVYSFKCKKDLTQDDLMQIIAKIK